MIIIEGSDLVGKTTLAKAIIEHGNRNVPGSRLNYGHLGLLPKGWSISDYLRMIRPWVVQDRWMLSEVVYGAVTRGETFLSEEDQLFLLDRAYAVGALHVVVTCDETLLRERYAINARREIFTEAQVVAVNVAFEDYMRSRFMYARPGWIWVRCDPRSPYPGSQLAAQIAESYAEIRKHRDLYLGDVNVFNRSCCP